MFLEDYDGVLSKKIFVELVERCEDVSDKIVKDFIGKFSE